MFPENELAWSIYQKVDFLGPGIIEMLGLKEELGELEFEKLLDRVMVIKSTVNRFEADNAGSK